MSCKFQTCTSCRGGALERCNKCLGIGEICATHDRAWLLCAGEWKAKADSWDELGEQLTQLDHFGFRAHNAFHVAPLLGTRGQHAAAELLQHLRAIEV